MFQKKKIEHILLVKRYIIWYYYLLLLSLLLFCKNKKNQTNFNETCTVYCHCSLEKSILRWWRRHQYFVSSLDLGKLLNTNEKLNTEGHKVKYLKLHIYTTKKKNLFKISYRYENLEFFDCQKINLKKWQWNILTMER